MIGQCRSQDVRYTPDPRGERIRYSPEQQRRKALELILDPRSFERIVLLTVLLEDARS